MEKFDAILCFFDQERKPDKLFIGEIVGDCNLLHFTGAVTEMGNPDNEMKIDQGEAGADHINFELGSGVGKYKVELRPQTHVTIFTAINLGLSGVCYQPDHPGDCERKKVMALFDPKRR